MNRRIIAITMTVLMMLTIVSGCGNKNDSNEASNLKDSNIITKGEWIQKINETFGMSDYQQKEPYINNIPASSPYYKDVQTAYEWNIIQASEGFDPDEKVISEYAIVTLFNAMYPQDAASLTTYDKVEILLSMGFVNDDSGVTLSKDDYLTRQTAQSILANAYDAWIQNHPLEKRINVNYQDNVIDLHEKLDMSKDIIITENSNGFRVTMPKTVANQITDNNIVIFPPTEKYPMGIALKILSKKETNGKIVLECDLANPEEMYSQIDFQGNFDGDLSQMQLADGVTLISAAKETELNLDNLIFNDSDIGLKAMPLGKPSDYDGASLDLEIDVTNETKVHVKIYPPSFDGAAKIDFHPFKSKKFDIEYFYIKVNLKAEEVFTTSFYDDSNVNPNDDSTKKNLLNDITSKKADQAIEKLVGRIPFYICPGISANFSLYLQLNLKGEVSLIFRQEGSLGKEVVNGKFRDFESIKCDTDFEMSAAARLMLTGEAAISLDYFIGKYDIYNFSLSIGPEIKAATNKYLCLKIDLFVRLEISFGRSSLIGDLFGLKGTLTLWGPDNSPLRKNWHIEDFRIVPECTKIASYKVSPDFNLCVLDNNGNACTNYEFLIRVADNEIYPLQKVTSNESPKIHLDNDTYNVILKGKDEKGQELEETVVFDVVDDAGSILEIKTKFYSKGDTTPSTSSSTTSPTAPEKEKDDTLEDIDINKGVRGNTVSNINNGGLVAKKGDWIYYVSVGDKKSYKIFKMRLDGTENQLLCDNAGIYLNIVGDWLYYCNDKGIYKIKLDGKGLEQISKDRASQMTVIDNYVFYHSGNAMEKESIRVITTDGKNRKILRDDVMWTQDHITVLDNSIYYNMYNTVYTLNIDGSDHKSIEKSDLFVDYMTVYNKNIYFSDNSFLHGVHYIGKMSDDGKDKQIFEMDMYTRCLNVYDGYIYYGKYYYDLKGKAWKTAGLWKMKCDGTQEQKISDAEIYGLLIFDRLICYYDSNGNLHRTDFEGSESDSTTATTETTTSSTTTSDSTSSSSSTSTTTTAATTTKTTTTTATTTPQKPDRYNYSGMLDELITYGKSLGLTHEKGKTIKGCVAFNTCCFSRKEIMDGIKANQDYYKAQGYTKFYVEQILISDCENASSHDLSFTDYQFVVYGY